LIWVVVCAAVDQRQRSNAGTIELGRLFRRPLNTHDGRGCPGPPARSDTERIAGERVERCSRHYRAVVMTDREALVLLARSVADAAPASMNEVAEVEGQLVSSTTICRASRT
jgi:hypothetical protein